MNKFLSDVFKEALSTRKSAWIAAVIIPGGFLVIGTYLITKTFHKKEKKDDQGRDNKGFNSPV